MHISKIAPGKKSLLVGIAGLIILFAILEMTNTTHLLHKQKVPLVIPTHTNTSQTVSSSVPSSRPGSDSTNGSQQASSTPADIANHSLITPFGNFVSNHSPGQNGSPNNEFSVCNTTPGATCYIEFTHLDTGETTQLPTQTTDARGSTSWYWDISKDAHLTSGEWQVKAVASLGNQTKSADDSLKLRIQ